MRFRDRRDAGRRLAAALESLRAERAVVVGLARGGVPVAAEVARRLGAPLDVMVARKIGAPGHPEYAVGAIAGDRLRLDEDAIVELGVSRQYLVQTFRDETEEMLRRERAYRQGRPPVPIEGRTVIVVDDGLATGLTAAVAVEAVRQQHPRRVVLAAPVCAPGSAHLLRRVADEVVCLSAPGDFQAVSLWYEDFRPTTDAEVIRILSEYNSAATASSAPPIPASA